MNHANVIVTKEQHLEEEIKKDNIVMNKMKIIALILSFVLSSQACSKRESINITSSSQKLYFNGKIYTVDTNQPWAEAMIIQGNSIVFVGYQAAGTLGRRVKDGEKEILMNNTGNADDRVSVKMKVHEMKGAFSGHSDIGLSKKYVSNLSVKPRKFILNHGEASKISNFSNVISRIVPGVKVYTPDNLESIRLN